MNILGNRLKSLRSEKEVGQKDIADFLNISTSAYGFYEQGKRKPPSEILNKLAEYFNVSVDYLLGRTDIKNIKNKSVEDEDPEEKDIEEMIDELMEQQGLMLCGEPMSDTDKILLRNSIRSTIELAKTMRNKK